MNLTRDSLEVGDVFQEKHYSSSQLQIQCSRPAGVAHYPPLSALALRATALSSG
jgi:hypothetical protein